MDARRRDLIRSIFAVALGYVAMDLQRFVLAFVAAGLFQAPPPPAWFLGLNLAAAFASAVAGGLLAARFGGRRSAFRLAVVALALGAAAIAFRGAYPQPTWYLAACLVLQPLGVMTGGGLSERRA